MVCKVVAVGRRRDGGTRYWCVRHHANATAKYGTPAKKCVAADDPPILPHETLDLDTANYPGGVALWGSVPAVYDTTLKPIDRGIHVHARLERGGAKDIDRTYRKLRLPVSKDLLSDGWAEVDEIDAINYMVAGVFGFKTIPVTCIYCGFSHLDRDWFAVHPHRRHQCHGCGRQFSDVVVGIGNPIATLRRIIGADDPQLIRSKRTLKIEQGNYPGGLQIWGSNPAIVWTSDKREEVGIHVHGFKNHQQEMPELDDTFSEVEIDGVQLDANQVRTYMAQSAMPHLDGRVISLECPSCGDPHFDQGEDAYTPHIEHCCLACNVTFIAKGSLKKTISNPFVGSRNKLSVHAKNPVRTDKLNLRPETI